MKLVLFKKEMMFYACYISYLLFLVHKTQVYIAFSISILQVDWWCSKSIEGATII